MRCNICICTPPLVAGLLAVPAGHSFSLFAETKLTAPDPTQGGYSASVSISGTTIVVGAHDSHDGLYGAGSAYVYERNQGGADNWGQVKQLVASDAAAGDVFGSSVSIFGDSVVVGAPRDGNDSGAVYVFERHHGGPGNWGEVKKLIAPDGQVGSLFGFSVSLAGDTLVVGAYGDDDSAGAAYVFERDQGGANNWGEVKKLLPSNLPLPNDNFGRFVSISGETVAVAAVQDSPFGSVYVFERNLGGSNNWGEVTILSPGDITLSNNFGHGLSIFGDTLAVGAPTDADQGLQAGAVYRYERNEGGPDAWGLVEKMSPIAAGAGASFGISISIAGGMMAVGAASDGPTQAGSAYVFQRHQGGLDNWGQIGFLTASDGAAADLFGASVSIAADTVVVSAPGDDADKQPDAGSAYVFVQASCRAGDVNEDGVVDVLDLVTVILSWGDSGVAADANGDGVVDVQDLVLVIVNWGPCEG